MLISNNRAIVGHTGSGKPVHALGHYRPDLYTLFSSIDHLDASNIHGEIADKLHPAKIAKLTALDLSTFQTHRDASNEHFRLSNQATKIKEGEG